MYKKINLECSLLGLSIFCRKKITPQIKDEQKGVDFIILHILYDDTLQSLESLDCGKIFRDAYGEMQSAPNAIRYFAGWADKIVGETIPVGEFKEFCFIHKTVYK